MSHALESLEVANLSGSLPRFTLLIAAAVEHYGKAAATLAIRQYLAQRRAVGLTSRFTALPVGMPPRGQVGAVVSWATQPLWAEDPAIEVATRNLHLGVEKLVLDSARDTIIGNVHRDPKAQGWARVTEAKPCAFCALMAIRGAVYRSDKTASFKSHDRCRCHAEPTFGPYEPSARVREWEQLYRDSTTGGNAARTRRQWRQAFDQTNPQQ